MQPFLVNLVDMPLYIAGYIIVGLILVAIAVKGRDREDVLLESTLPARLPVSSPRGVAPDQMSAPSSESEEGSTRSLEPALNTRKPPSRLTIATIFLARLMEGACARSCVWCVSL